MGRARKIALRAPRKAEDGVVVLHRLPEIRTLDRRKMLREMVPIWKAAGDVQGKVRLIFDYHKPEIDALRGTLYQQSVADYGLALTAEAQAAGYAISGVSVTDPKVLKGLGKRADYAAKSIARTHNADLRRQITRIRADVPKANRWVYSSRLEAWEKNRAAWKSSQIATTELGEVARRGKADFIDRNNLQGKARGRVSPSSAMCPLCVELVGHGSMEVDLAMSLPVPAHVGCVHYIEIVYDKEGMPAANELWLAGAAVMQPGGLMVPPSLIRPPVTGEPEPEAPAFGG